MKKIVIVYDSKTGRTAQAARYIQEGICSADVQADCFLLTETVPEKIDEADGILLGCPTYMASASYRMIDWLQKEAPKRKLAGKLGGAFATEQYIHGGAENVLLTLLTHELVFGMAVYSGGSAYGKPVIHLGPVGLSEDIGAYQEIFREYGRRFALQLSEHKG